MIVEIFPLKDIQSFLKLLLHIACINKSKLQEKYFYNYCIIIKIIIIIITNLNYNKYEHVLDLYYSRRFSNTNVYLRVINGLKTIKSNVSVAYIDR